MGLLISRSNGKSLKAKRISQEKQIDEAATAEFYSSWHYSAVRLTSAIPGLQDPDAIAEALGLSRAAVRKVLEFLVSYELCRKEGEVFVMGARTTHLGSDSMMVNKHRTNWRLQGLLSMEKQNPEDLFYAGPMVLSQQDIQSVRKELVSVIEKTVKTAEASASEQLACLNIDWFRIKR